MYAHIIRRLLYMIVVLFIMSAIVFSLMSLVTGDPVVMMLGQDADKETVEKIRERLGLNRPIIVQYADWISHVIKGDLGASYTMPMTVCELILQRLPVTVELTLLSITFSLLVAIPLGIIAAIKFNSKIDIFLLSYTVAGISMPNFWIGILLIFLFSLELRILPASGYVSFLTSPLENLKLMILPVLTLSAWYIAVYLRFTRSTFIEGLRSEYILVARSKGILEKRVLWVHAFKNTLIPLVTVIGMTISGLFGGAVVTETIFALPGIGRLLVDAIFARDLPLIEGIVLLITVSVVFCNLIVDIVYVYIDPRIRYE
ncbi:MAG: ABC transporter permease [Candidatus Hodarchaeota archaeon]